MGARRLGFLLGKRGGETNLDARRLGGRSSGQESKRASPPRKKALEEDARKDPAFAVGRVNYRLKGRGSGRLVRGE